MQEFELCHDWSGEKLTRPGPRVKVELSPHPKGLQIFVRAPFFDDPAPPGGQKSEPYGGLWDYEVVEAFFLDSSRRRYLEVELAPRGEHLVLLLDGRRNAVAEKLQLDTKSAEIDAIDGTWSVSAVIPFDYFPPDVAFFNLYAIHNATKGQPCQQFQGRCYECLFPLPGDEGQNFPDFHRLERFQGIEDVVKLLPGNEGGRLFRFWTEKI